MATVSINKSFKIEDNENTKKLIKKMKENKPYKNQTDIKLSLNKRLNFSFHKLETLIKDKSESKIKHLLKDFKSRDIDVEKYIKNNMYNDEITANTRSYFIMDKKIKKIYLYFTIKNKAISLMLLSKEKRQQLIGDSRISTVEGILLAHLGKNKNYISKSLNTPLIWDTIYSAIKKLQFRYRLIIVDYKIELVPYYQKQGFIKINNDNLNNLVTLYKPNTIF